MDAHDIFKKLTKGTSLCFKSSYNHHSTKSLVEVMKSEYTGPAANNNEEKKKKLSKAKRAALEQEEVSRLRNEQRISVSGPDVPAPLRNFEELSEKYGVSSVLVSNLNNSGYAGPTPIQAQAIPLMLQGRQILACAPTGSGKTAAFLIPVLQQLGRPSRLGIRAVVVSPTRELAKQTLRECMRLGEGTGLRAHVINKANVRPPGSSVKAIPRCDVLITTPNRLVYLLQQEPPCVSLSSVEWLVVDESDKLFEAGARGFRDQLAVIYNTCSSSALKRAMFSATSTPDVARWARKNLANLAFVSVGIRNSAAEEVQQELVFVGSEAGKLVAFRNLVHEGLKPPVLVFVQSKDRAKELFSELLYEGINVDVIHADRTQLQRDNVVRCFREGKIWVLICTELMGRGMDFKGVNLVVNYDFPTSVISYIHRIGRTGRAGHPGRAITFFTQDDSSNLRSVARIVKDSGGDVPDYMLNMKKPSKRVRRKLEKTAPERESISTTPVYLNEKMHRVNWGRLNHEDYAWFCSPEAEVACLLTKNMSDLLENTMKNATFSYKLTLAQ